MERRPPDRRAVKKAERKARTLSSQIRNVILWTEGLPKIREAALRGWAVSSVRQSAGLLIPASEVRILHGSQVKKVRAATPITPDRTRDGDSYIGRSTPPGSVSRQP